MEPVILEDWSYMVDMGPGVDSWRLSGRAFGHPNIPEGDFVLTSTPVEYDPVTRLLKTASGRLYLLGTCKGEEKTQTENIYEDIARGGSEHW